jgi:LacI family transcriptional regulator
VIMVTLPEAMRALYAPQPSLPVISLDEGDADWQMPVVYINNRADGYMATNHLLSLGRRRIGIILPTPLDRRPSLRRLEGFQDAHKEHNLEPDPRLIVATDYTLQSAYDLTLRMLQDGPLPDALFVADDKRALAVVEAIRNRGLRIPEDIALVGHGDWMVGRYMCPSLTSIHHPFREMGRTAAEKALQLIAGETIASENVMMPTYLVVRESCGAPPEMRTAEGIRE